METKGFESTTTENKLDKLSILILAHKNINQLSRLLKQLSHNNIDIFIHIDKKWNLSDDKINELKSINDGGIFICDNRISASLDTWSLVEATMALIKKTKLIENEKGINYKYTALLSGQDYPIKSIDYIQNFLNESYPKPFIDCTPYDRENWLYHKFNCLPTEIKIMRFINSCLDKGLFRKIVKLPFYLFFKIIKHFHTVYDDLRKLNCELYGGSAWWILPDVAIDDILYKYHNPNDKIVAVLKNTLTPEETFFQIMVMQSKVASMVNVNPKDMIAQSCMTYAYFSDEDKPFVGHPYIFTAADYYKIIKLPHFFARKFDESIDSEIFDMIDEKILNVNGGK